MASHSPTGHSPPIEQHHVVGVGDMGNVTAADNNNYNNNPDQIQYYGEEARYYQSSVDGSVMEAYAEKPPPPPRRRFYKQKKYWIICSILTAIIVVVVVLLIIFVFFPMIAQSIMNKAGINVNKADITFSLPDNDQGAAVTKRQEATTYDMNTTFFMHMGSKLTNTGPFSADIHFHNPLNVYYNDTVLLGTITLPDTHVSGGHGSIDAITPFTIQDTAVFAAFAKEMLALESFKWRIKGKLDIHALTRSATVDLDKTIELQGMNGFPEVSIESFDMPANAPEGGIQVKLGTVLTSPSPIGVQLGTIALEIAYDGVMLGRVTSDNVTLIQGENKLMLAGALVPQSEQANLDKIGALFSRYISGNQSITNARGLSCAPNGHDPIGWLSEGFQSVQLNVGLGLKEPMNIIHGVSMGLLDMSFSSDAPYAPIVSAPAVTADFSIPFGFSLNITEVSQELNLGTNASGDFAVISTPFVPSQSDQASGKLQFGMSNVSIAAMDNKHAEFDKFTYDLTASDAYTFNVGGKANTKTSTPIGDITLSGITFKVPTTLHGLQFLNSTATVVNGVDVIGGTSDALQLSINVTMDNPSDFSITTGDVSFAFLASGTQLGQVMLSNLKLNRGSNSVSAASTFDPKSSSVGQNLLSSFVMGQNNEVMISGYDGSTAIQSLATAFSAITLTTTLPGLTSSLVQGSKLTVNEDSATTGVVTVQVSIANPFTAGLSITSVKSAVTYKGMPVGNIDQDISSNPIVIGGHSTAQSSPLSMTMNVEPASVALLLRELAVSANMDTRALDALLGMGGLHVQGMEDVSADSSLFQGFNVSSYVMQAMKALSADLQLQSGLTIGEYVNTLEFSQSNVAVQTDDTVTRLIPIVGQPIVQQIVDGAILGFDSVVLSSPTDTSFKVQMSGSITNAGPMDAQISFPSPLTIAWEGRVLGTVQMATIDSKADVGAQFNVPGDFSVADQEAMGDFAAYMINNPDFQWNIYTDAVNVNALGLTFTNVKMNKFVTLAGANGFKDAVKINKFDLPSNDPAGGITLTASTTINNPSQVGFNLAGAGFSAYFEDVLLGPLASDGAAVFPPRGTANINMKGRLIPQESQEGIDAVTKVFENYLGGKDTPLTVVGDSGSGPNGQVSWLTKGFKAIKIENVIMPGPDAIPSLITSIELANMQMDLTKDPYAPPTSSDRVQAQLQNPFGFPLGVSKISMDTIAGLGGHNIANLVVKDESASTSDTGLVTTQFSNVPFKVYDDAHDYFDAFVKMLTSTSNVTFELSGKSDAVASTAIGSLSLDGITFGVDTTLAGFNNFGGTSPIQSLTVTGATSEYIIVSVTFTLTNPSQITAKLGDIVLDVIMTEFDASVGKVYVKDLLLVPGANTVGGEMHMMGSNLQALGQLLSDYMTNANVPLNVRGSVDSTSIPSLKQALSTVSLSTNMQGINASLIQSVNVKATDEILTTRVGYSYITIRNPLDTPFTISHVKADVNGMNYWEVYGTLGRMDAAVDPPVTIPAGGTAVAENLKVQMDPELADDTTMAMMLLNGMEGNLAFDIAQNATVTIGDGFQTIMYYYQDQVAASIELVVGFSASSLNLTVPDNTTATANASSWVPEVSSTTSVPVSSVSDQPSQPSDSATTTTTDPVDAGDSSDTVTPTPPPSNDGQDTESPSTTPDEETSDAATTTTGETSGDDENNQGSSDDGDSQPSDNIQQRRRWLWPLF